MTDRLDELLTRDGQVWRNELGAAPPVQELFGADARASAPTDSPERSSRRRPPLALAVACSVLAIVAIAVTLSVLSRSPGNNSADKAATSFVGSRWRAIDVAHAGKHTTIAPRLNAFFGFSDDGTYTSAYGYNGRYRTTRNGYRTYHVSVPYNLRSSTDPTVRTLIAAAQAVSTPPGEVITQRSGQQLTLAIGAYRITCVRVGAQENPPSQLPSSTKTAD